MNRTIYDTCAYVDDLQRSAAPLSFILDPIKYEHCNKCRPELGIVGGTAVSHVSPDFVAIENDLRNRNRPMTRCPQFHFIPRDDGVLQGKEYIKPVCHPRIEIKPHHLKPCQFQSYPEVPPTPPLDLFECPQRRK